MGNGTVESHVQTAFAQLRVCAFCSRVGCAHHMTLLELPFLSLLLFSRCALETKMKTIIFLTALVALAAAFDFPEDWKAWKRVGLCMLFLK